MPNRTIKESCKTSESLDQLSDFAERMWWRLVTVADDYGRFSADPRVILAACFPLKIETLKISRVLAAFEEFERTNLVTRYSIDGKSYAFMPGWPKHQRIRCAVSKFPDPPDQAPLYSSFRQRAIPRELRLAVLERDRNRCLACDATEFLVLDHIIPVVRGGLAELGNLQTLCDDCNSAKYTQTLNLLVMDKPAQQFAAIRRELRQNAPDLRSTDHDQRVRVRSKTKPLGQLAPAGASADRPIPLPKPICRECAQVLEALNALTGARNGRGYQVDPLKGHYPRLHARHAEAGLEACLAVVRVVGGRLRRSDDPKFHKFARPRTLFGPENWEEYLVEASEGESEAPTRPDPSGTPARRDPGPIDQELLERALRQRAADPRFFARPEPEDAA